MSNLEQPKNDSVAVSVFQALLQPIWTIIVLTIMGVMITYIVQIRARLEKLVDENLNLLNRMHEGLIMLSGKDRKLFFASTPAATLLNQLPGMDKPDEKGEKNAIVTEETLQKPIFELVEMSIKG
jgi:hypothetical protein